MSIPTRRFTEVRYARCSCCEAAWFNRWAVRLARRHARMHGHAVVVEVVHRLTFNPDAKAPEVAAALERSRELAE